MITKSNHIIVGLDIGTFSTKSLAALFKPGEEKLEVLSQVSRPSLGMRRGVVVNSEKVAEVVSSVLSRTEEECGVKIDNVLVNINGGHLFTTSSHGSVAVSRADQRISEEDIERVIREAQTFSLPLNREILEVFPKEFVVDGEAGIRQPLGMKGVRLEAEILVLGYFAPYFNELTEAVLSSGVQAHIVADPLAGAEAVLTPREKELGVLFVDIGAGTTGFCVYKEGVLLTAGVVPIGSFHITKDIASGLQVDVDTAERIKLKFASCFLKGSKRIKVKELVSDEKVEFSQARLGKIIDARTLEIFQQIEKELKKISFPKLPGGLVLSGGGANLPRIKDFGKKALKLASRIGHSRGFFPEQKDLEMACVCGLVLKGKGILEEEISSRYNLWRGVKKILRDFIP
jgi:cell division protein FtsA